MATKKPTEDQPTPSRSVVSAVRVAEICATALGQVLDVDGDYNDVYDYSDIAKIKGLMMSAAERAQEIDKHISEGMLLDRVRAYAKDYLERLGPEFPRLKPNYGSGGAANVRIFS